MTSQYFKEHKLPLLFISGIVLEIVYLFYTAASEVITGKQNILLFMVIYGVAFLVFFFAWFIISRMDENADIALPEQFRKYILPLIIGFGILFRLTLIPTQPSTSDDYYRYVWEGKMIVHGYNPYGSAPGDSVLNSLHSNLLPEKVTFKKFTTIYPPAAQVVFTLAYLIGNESVFGLKVIFFLADICTIFLLIQLLGFLGYPKNLVLLYAWLPLPIMEFFINAHIDVAALPFFILFILLVVKQKPIPAAIVFALCILMKSYAIFALPVLWHKFSWRQIGLFGLIALGLVVAAYVPFINKQHPITDMLSNYLMNWEFNGSLYNVFKLILNNGTTSRLICLGILALSGLYITFTIKDSMYKLAGIYIVVVACTTTIYPWYLGWLAVLLPFFGFYSVAALFFMINFTNITPYGVVWHEHLWIIFVEYLVFYALLFFDIKKFYNKKRSFSDSEPQINE